MNIEELRDYCLRKKATSEGFPFGDDTLVFKVMDKMFVLVNLEGELRINLKCDPEKAIELREQYPAVIPGYHMNKQQWNTVVSDGSVSDKLIFEWVDHSYQQVIAKLSKTKQKKLNQLS
ncbi:MAG: MmcQ/YjbR family DNA-binding protein [Bacteroidota bacterium]|nr:MmcQ/YjbR family DNA-binding protein [Bacteroidota bacterium]